VLRDLSLDITVLFRNRVDLAIQHVHVVVQRVVLLLRLYESRHYFLSRRDTCRLLYLNKRILNDLHITVVHVHEVLLLLVV
jgi:hypothetical protein